MQNGMKRMLSIAVVLVAAFGLTACSKEWKPERNTVRIQKDKPVSQAMFFEKDADKALKSELFEELRSKVEEYNNTYGKDMVVITTPKADKQKAEDLDFVKLDYFDIKEFGRFNDYSVYDGEIDKAKEYGFDIGADFFKVEKGQAEYSKAVKAGEIDAEGAKLLILDPLMQPYDSETDSEGDLNYFELVDASVIFATQNIMISDEHTVAVSPESSDLGYVIYK